MGVTRMCLDGEWIPNLVLAAVGNHQTELPEGIWEEDRCWSITTI